MTWPRSESLFNGRPVNEVRSSHSWYNVPSTESHYFYSTEKREWQGGAVGDETMTARTEMKQQCETEASTHTKIYLKAHTFMHGETWKLFLILTKTLSWQTYANSLKNDLTLCPTNSSNPKKLP